MRSHLTWGEASLLLSARWRDAFEAFSLHTSDACTVHAAQQKASVVFRGTLQFTYHQQQKPPYAGDSDLQRGRISSSANPESAARRSRSDCGGGDVRARPTRELLPHETLAACRMSSMLMAARRAVSDALFLRRGASAASTSACPIQPDATRPLATFCG
jgi:hypothetical protein